MENYKTKIHELNPVKLSIEFEIPSERVSSELENVYLQIQKTAIVPGFRQGKAPMEIVKQRYAQTAKEKTIENLINDSLYPFLKEKNINPVGSPVIENINFEFNKPFTYKVVLEQHPKIVAKDYKKLKLEKKVKKITDEDIKNTLEEMRKYNIRLVEKKDGNLTENDCAIVDYTAWLDGKELKEIKAENHLIDLSQKQILPGLAEGLLGAKPKEIRELQITLPEDFPKKEIANKTIILKVSIKNIKEKQLPSLDDNFAKEIGYKTLSELKDKIKETLEKNAEKNAESQLEEQIVNSLLSANRFTVPETLINEQKEYLLQTAIEKLLYQGFPKELIEKQTEFLEKKSKEEAEKQVRLMYILNSIAEQENIKVTDEDINQKKQEILNSNPGKEKLVEHYFKNEIDRLIPKLKIDKIFGFIKENSKIKEISVQ
ncbi:MAG: trigger factor [Endomicrobiia bacterium]